MRSTALRIGEVAARAGVPTPTLRFYERRGILKAPPRLASGYRAYGVEAVATVRFIKRIQELGFSLAEAEELLRLRDGRGECAEVRRVAEAKLAAIDEKIRRLKQVRAALQSLGEMCGKNRKGPCPILSTFGEELDA